MSRFPLWFRSGPAEILKADKVVLQDFFRNEYDRKIYMDLLVPLSGAADAQGPLGLLVLRINPENYLFPFIQRWPSPSRSAETLLVRREGNGVVFLNELRFRKNTALNLHIPLDHAEVPAVQAALGREGVFEGTDYQGARVVAALKTIPDSPWALVARMDIAEVYSPMREKLWQTVLLILGLISGMGALTWQVWRHQNLRFYREKLAAAEKLTSSNVRYRRFFEATRDGILILDGKTGMVEDVNSSFSGLLGLPRGKFLEKKAWELGFLNPIVADEGKFLEMQRKEDLYLGEVSLETNDGLKIDVEFTSRAYLVAGRKVLQLNFHDISARKRAEKLERQSALKLQDKNAELERFLYTVSHDLKSPVVTVRTFLGYLEQDMADAKTERAAKDMGFIRDAANKMGQLLDDILEISRIGRAVTPPENISLRALVEESLAAVAGPVSERGVRVQTGGENLALYGDRVRLGGIWQNLLENAVKFMGGQKEPRIETGVEARGAETVFFVRDNGVGIDPRYQEKIFGLFERVDAKTEGTGIGLAVVKRIVGQYGGRVWVESGGPGQGACFCFTLPGAVQKSKEGVST